MKTKKSRPISFLAAGILGVLVALGITCSFGIMKVQGESMEPSIAKGDVIVVNKFYYLFGEPSTGDAVVFPCNVYSEDGEGSFLIRRVVATEGDQVEIKDGMLYVNDKICDSYTENPVYMESMDKITVGKHKVFVLSDNRGAVLDSRDQAVGQMDISELTGKVCFK